MDETIKNLINPKISSTPFNLAFRKVNKLFIKKFELAALTPAMGRTWKNVRLVMPNKKYTTKRWTKIPVAPTNPKLIALLGIILFVHSKK